MTCRNLNKQTRFTGGCEFLLRIVRLNAQSFWDQESIQEIKKRLHQERQERQPESLPRGWSNDHLDSSH